MLKMLQKVGNSIVILSMVFSQFGWAVGKAAAASLPEAFSKSSPGNGANHQVHDGFTLYWGDSTYAVSYEYCIDTSSNDSCDGDNWVSTNTDTSVTLDLYSLITYYWQVRAVNTYGTTYADSGTWWSFRIDNDSPVITEGGSVTVTMSKNGSPTAFDLTLHATDADADPISWSIRTDRVAAEHGTPSASGTGNSIVIGYTPVEDYLGWDAFEVHAEDGYGGTDDITVKVDVYDCSDDISCITIGPDDPLHIAYALVTEGENASLGIDSRNGVEIAIDDSLGKILDHDIQFDGENEGCTPEGGTAAGTALAADPSIVAVIGTSCSGAAQTAMPLLSAAGMTMVSPSNTRYDLTEAGNPNNHPGYLRTSINDKLQGAAAAQFAHDSLGITTAATIIENGNSYSWEAPSLIRKASTQVQPI
jgi:ABC-type branched-subunit amino acid transport system substrate-binding protein